MKKLFSAFIAAFALLAFSCTSTSAALRQSDIIVLYTNDVHCGLEENIGYAGLEHYKQQMKKQTPYVTLADAGDFSQGGLVASVSKGENIISIMNRLGYEVVTPGNHEFDYGLNQFFKMSKLLKCGFISSNIRSTKTGKKIFPSYKIIKYGNTKVAYIGVSTPESITKSTPAYFQDENKNILYDFGEADNASPLIKGLQDDIDTVRAKGADYVIIVGHLGQDGIHEGWTSYDIASQIKGADVILDGHSHEVIPEQKVEGADGKTVLISQTGTKLKNIGKLVITPEGEISTSLVNDVTDENGIKASPEIQKFIEDIKKTLDGTLSEKIGSTDFDLKAVDEKGEWLVRDRQTNLGDIVTDAIREYFNADVAIVNGGGLRADIKKGDITYGDAVTTLPFGNKLCMSEMKGSVLLDELEYAVRNLPKTSGGFFHVSGMTFKVDSSIPTSVATDEQGFFESVKGARRIHDVLINGTPIDAQKTYKVASIDYVLKSNGDGHIFKDSTVIKDEPVLLCDALKDYIKSFGKKIPDRYKESQNRIVIE